MRRVIVAPAAGADIQDAVQTSFSRRGRDAARRYRKLIGLAIRELREEPDRPSAKRAGIGDLRLYPLRLAARRLDPANAVRAAPHVLAYRFDATTLEIVRLLHEAMDFPRQLERALGEDSGA